MCRQTEVAGTAGGSLPARRRGDDGVLVPGGESIQVRR